MNQFVNGLPLKGKVKSLLDVLHDRASHQPEQTAYTFLVDGEKEEISLTYAELHQRVNSLASYLSTVADAGDRALLLYPPSLDYIVAFFACLRSHLIAIPAYPPRHNKSLGRLEEIVKDAQPRLALTTQATLCKAQQLLNETSKLNALQWLATDTAAPSEEDWQEPEITPEMLAFLQYTSGSTGVPKGVMVTHGNILHNLALIYEAFEHHSQSKGLIWLPPYHDMGLIGGILQPLYGGFPVILMSPAHFLQKPLRWLQAISRYRATTSGGPNFAYDLCVRKVKPEHREELDLSSWNLAFNGAETIRAKTLNDFATTFASCGFQRRAFYPCYGLAEATLLVAGGPQAKDPIIHSIPGEGGLPRSLSADSSEESEQPVVSCGQPRGQQVVIVDPDTLTPCDFGQVGEVWVSDPSVAKGYWNQPEETQKTFHAALGKASFLRTGDLGFLKDGHLFIAGRIKEVMIIRGCNYYPQDIEFTVEHSHPAIHTAAGAAFSVDVDRAEKLVIVQEVRRSSLRNLSVHEVIAHIRQAIAEQHQLQTFSILLVKPGSIPKTSSGKTQRYACREMFLNSEFEAITD
jgi:acyl-CoA synthetase (AMP-forming)/AMP-acid ligase II